MLRRVMRIFHGGNLVSIYKESTHASLSQLPHGLPSIGTRNHKTIIATAGRRDFNDDETVNYRIQENTK